MQDNDIKVRHLISLKQNFNKPVSNDEGDKMVREIENWMLANVENSVMNAQEVHNFVEHIRYLAESSGMQEMFWKTEDQKLIHHCITMRNAPSMVELKYEKFEAEPVGAPITQKLYDDMKNAINKNPSYPKPEM